MADSDRARAYVMAVGAWRRFGHSSESEAAFATRIASVGETGGLEAAAKAISDDCNAHGLQMSPRRVLKGYTEDAQHPENPGPQPLPPGIQRIVDSKGKGGGCAVAFMIVGGASAAAWLTLLH